MTLHNLLPPLNPGQFFNPFRASLGQQFIRATETLPHQQTLHRESKDSGYEIPTREGKDSECNNPSGGGKNSLCTVSQSSCIYSRKYTRPPGRRQTKVVRKTMGKTRCSSLPFRPPQTRLSPTLQRTPEVVQDTMYHQQLQRSRQKQCLIDFYSKPPLQKRYREGKQERQSRVLQSTLLSSQTVKPVETGDKPQFSKSVPHGFKIQNGNPRINLRIS